MQIAMQLRSYKIRSYHEVELIARNSNYDSVKKISTHTCQNIKFLVLIFLFNNIRRRLKRRNLRRSKLPSSLLSRNVVQFIGNPTQLFVTFYARPWDTPCRSLVHSRYMRSRLSSLTLYAFARNYINLEKYFPVGTKKRAISINVLNETQLLLKDHLLITKYFQEK